MINSIDRDGLMEGFDIPLIRSVAESVSIPVIALGEAGRMDDFVATVWDGKASAASDGSFFVFHGRRRAVLISFPSQEKLRQAFGQGAVKENESPA